MSSNSVPMMVCQQRQLWNCLLLVLGLACALPAEVGYWVVRDTRAHSAQQVWEAASRSAKEPLVRGRFNGGIDSAAYWLVIPSSEWDPLQKQGYLAMDGALMDMVEVWGVSGDSSILVGIGGDRRPFWDRMLKYPHFVIPMERLYAASAIAIRLTTHDGLFETVRVRLLSEDQISYWLVFRILWPFLLVCILCLLSVGCILLFVVQRRRLYLYFVGYTLSFSLWILQFHGLGDFLLFPHLAIGNQWIQGAIMLFLCFVALFGSELLQLEVKRVRFAKVVKLGVLLAVLGGVPLFVFDHYRLFFSWILPWGCLSVFALLAAAAVGAIQGDRDSRFFMGSWLLFLVGGLSYSAKVFGLFPSNWFTEAGFELGVVAQALGISVGIAYRFYDEQRRMNLNLEREVAARTHELQKTNKQLELLSTTDPLTGLWNRRKFYDLFFFSYSQAMRNQLPVALMMIDVDYFKRYNDHYGHLVGDDCLKQVAGVLEKVILRACDFCCRFGGEEFLVCLAGTDASGARIVAERVQGFLAEQGIPHEKSEHRLVTVSIGISVIPGEQANEPERVLDEHLQKADQALYAAKAAGRNQVAI